jgi:hypothetical protein
VLLNEAYADPRGYAKHERTSKRPGEAASDEIDQDGHAEIDYNRDDDPKDTGTHALLAAFRRTNGSTPSLLAAQLRIGMVCNNVHATDD